MKPMSTLVFVGCNYDLGVIAEVEAHDTSILFEPIPEVVEALRAEFSQLKYAHKAIKVVKAACWREPIWSKFHLYNRDHNGASSSLGTITAESVENYSQFDLSCVGSIDVKCVVLSDYMPYYVDKLIIDAQGADLAILKTVQAWLTEKRIGVIEIEADGEGCKNYDGLDDNSEGSLLQFMGQYDYQAEKIAGRVVHNPDYRFTRRQNQ